jgi:uncharacterized protein YacL (UPF0231 family)
MLKLQVKISHYCLSSHFNMELDDDMLKLQDIEVLLGTCIQKIP